MPSCAHHLFTPLWFMKQACTPTYAIYGDPPQTSQRALITSSNESQHVRFTCLETRAELLSIQTAAVRIAEITNIKKIWGFFGISAGGALQISTKEWKPVQGAHLPHAQDSHSGAAGSAKEHRGNGAPLPSGVITRQWWIHLLKSANNQRA